MKGFLRSKILRLACPVTLGVISDTHANSLDPHLLEQVRTIFSGIRDVIHLGDVTCPAVLSDLESCGFVVHPVLGNNDRLLNSPHVMLIESGPWRIAATHGGGGGYFEVSGRAMRQVLSVFEPPIHALMHGHSHVHMLREQEGIWYFNPGSLGFPRMHPDLDGPPRSSVGLLKITPEQMVFSHFFPENSAAC